MAPSCAKPTIFIYRWIYLSYYTLWIQKPITYMLSQYLCLLSQHTSQVQRPPCTTDLNAVFKLLPWTPLPHCGEPVLLKSSYSPIGCLLSHSIDQPSNNFIWMGEIPFGAYLAWWWKPAIAAPGCTACYYYGFKPVSTGYRSGLNWLGPVSTGLNRLGLVSTAWAWSELVSTG